MMFFVTKTKHAFAGCEDVILDKGAARTKWLRTFSVEDMTEKKKNKYAM